MTPRYHDLDLDLRSRATEFVARRLGLRVASSETQALWELLAKGRDRFTLLTSCFSNGIQGKCYANGKEGQGGMREEIRCVFSRPQPQQSQVSSRCGLLFVRLWPVSGFHARDRNNADRSVEKKLSFSHMPSNMDYVPPAPRIFTVAQRSAANHKNPSSTKSFLSFLRPHI